MIASPAFLLLVLGAVPAQSQEVKPRTELPIQAPVGWESREQDSTLLLTPRDLAPGQVYTVLVPGLTEKVGTVRRLLVVAKTTLGQVGDFKPANEPAGAKTDPGWEFETVIGTLTKSGKDLLAQAMGLRKGEKEGVILVISDSVATMQKYSEAFNTMVRTMDTPKGVPAAPAAEGQVVDLVYSSPQGWKAESLPGGGSVALSWSNAAVKNTFDPVRTCRLLILPSQPMKDGLRQTFVGFWDALVKPTFETSIVPLPMFRRLKSGLLCAFDIEDRAKMKDGRIFEAGLYVVAQGNRAVPIVAVFESRGRDFDAPLLRLMESARLPNASDDKIVPFTSADIAGEWGESSMSAASYVTASGQLAGDASIAIASGVTLGPDGDFKWHFVGVGRGQSIVENDQGKWSVEDTFLILEGKSRRRRYVVYGFGKDAKGSTFLVTSLSDSSEVPLALGFPRGPNHEKWYKKKE